MKKTLIFSVLALSIATFYGCSSTEMSLTSEKSPVLSDEAMWGNFDSVPEPAEEGAIFEHRTDSAKTFNAEKESSKKADIEHLLESSSDTRAERSPFRGLSFDELLVKAGRPDATLTTKEAQYRVGLAYLQGHVFKGKRVKPSETNATRYFKLASDAGHLESQGRYAEALYYGKGTKENHGQGVALAKKAADAGSAHAQYLLGNVTSKNPRYQDQSIDWYTQAAEQGHADAAKRLGDIYYRGKLGTPTNDVSALRWYRQAAEHGDLKSQMILAAWYEKGGRSLKSSDLKEAAYWLRRAMAQGDEAAAFRLASLYETSGVVSKNYSEAAMIYHRLAERGGRQSQYRLFRMYHKGLGVERDDVEAYKWLSLATTDKKNEKTQELQERFSQRLSEVEVTEAAARVAAFKKDYVNLIKEAEQTQKKEKATKHG